MSEENQRPDTQSDLSFGKYMQGRTKSVLTIATGLVGGWYAGYVINKVTPASNGITAAQVEKFGGPFKGQLKGMAENNLILYETVGSALGGTAAAVYRGFSGWKKDKQQRSDVNEIKQNVAEIRRKLEAPTAQVSETQSEPMLSQESQHER